MTAGRAWKAGLALCFAASSLAAAAPVQPKPRVASVTVCGDMYALMLADRSQIAAVSPEADGPLAYYPERARGLARNRGDLEALIAAHADVVLLEEGGKPQLARALQRLGIKPVFGSKNPFPFMELQDVQELTNFFERRVSAYQVAVEGEVAFHDDF